MSFANIVAYSPLPAITGSSELERKAYTVEAAAEAEGRKRRWANLYRIHLNLGAERDFYKYLFI